MQHHATCLLPIINSMALSRFTDTLGRIQEFWLLAVPSQQAVTLRYVDLPHLQALVHLHSL